MSTMNRYMIAHVIAGFSDNKNRNNCAGLHDCLVKIFVRNPLDQSIQALTAFIIEDSTRDPSNDFEFYLSVVS